MAHRPFATFTFCESNFANTAGLLKRKVNNLAPILVERNVLLILFQQSILVRSNTPIYGWF